MCIIIGVQEEEGKVGDDTEDTAGDKKGAVATITDEVASEIFDKLTKL